ncbi:MAG TPA: cytochrome c peroxidase, partial [Bryobacteraceae bacterium]|nr:cytochrome c peroxidase [Bryobacteraceae bacterium]
LTAAAHAQELPVPLQSLKQVTVPEPPDLTAYVQNRQLAIVLGKALFWDMQAGSDGVQACGTCHFHAGADNRSKNQLSPATSKVGVNWEPAPDYTFPFGGPNYQLNRDDFPFRRLQDPNNRASTVLSDRNAIVSSQGIHKSEFIGVKEGRSADTIRVTPDSIFQVNGINVRQVPSRSTPSVINAVFNDRQFWDGRAQSVFNGVNGWGDRDPTAKVLKATAPGKLTAVRIRILNSSLASQAVGPPTSETEASAGGRTFVDIATKLTPHARKDRNIIKKLRSLRPLGRQLVAPDDSVLGPHSAFPDRGLGGPDAGSYITLIQKAFRPEWWNSDRQILIQPDNTLVFLTEKEAKGKNKDTYSLLEYNFGLFFGLAIQMYEATLVSDDTPFDRYLDGDDRALTPEQKHGLELFSNSTTVRCINCHGGAEFTNASAATAGPKGLFRRSGNLLDTGFNNIGLRPTREDPGIGATDLWGKPLSAARAFATNDPTYRLDYHGTPGVDGAFKTPGLRNVELTAPYFHTGSILTLSQAVDFYSRGGDFQPIESRNGYISPLNTLNLSEGHKNALVAFLGALTDERVRYKRAPFDHPEILVPDGHFLGPNLVFNDGSGRAVDELRIIPAVGRMGLIVPIRGFLD